MSGKEDLAEQRLRLLPVSTHFPSLTSPENAVVFLDVCPEVGAPAVRIYVELFYQWCPAGAENVRQMATGEARRGGARRQQGPATTLSEAPVGYKGSRFYESAPGREVVGGDVVRGDGTGTAASIHGEGGAFTVSGAADTNFTKDKRALLSHTPGLVRLQPVSAVSPFEVGSALAITVVPPNEMTAQTAEDPWWATVVGRVVGRGTDPAADVRAALQCLDRTSKIVFRCRQSSDLTNLPILTGCGEM